MTLFSDAISYVKFNLLRELFLGITYTLNTRIYFL